MDEPTRRALTRAIISFLVVVVVGSAIVSAVGNLRSAGETPSPSTSVTPSTSVSAAPDRPAAWLAWVPGGLPNGFGDQITSVPSVTATTTETADIAWLTTSTDAKGAVVDDPADPYRVPIDVTGVEPAFASFLPEPERSDVTSLGAGEGILSESGAAMRGLGPGATMTFATGKTITVTTTLPDVMMGSYELLVTRATGETIGVTHERYVLFQVKDGFNPDPAELGARFEPYLPQGARYNAVEVRRPLSTRFLRPNDGELPPVLLKRRFGEFTAAPDSTSGAITVDPLWVESHIESRNLPVLGTVTCHAKVLGMLTKAMGQSGAAGTTDLISDVGDCYDASIDPTDPEGELTARDFGAAIDLNANANPPGEPPSADTQPKELVDLMSRAGFGWGGKDAWPQGSLFRYRHPVAPTG